MSISNRTLKETQENQEKFNSYKNRILNYPKACQWWYV